MPAAAVKTGGPASIRGPTLPHGGEQARTLARCWTSPSGAQGYLCEQDRQAERARTEKIFQAEEGLRGAKAGGGAGEQGGAPREGLVRAGGSDLPGGHPWASGATDPHGPQPAFLASTSSTPGQPADRICGEGEAGHKVRGCAASAAQVQTRERPAGRTRRTRDAAPKSAFSVWRAVAPAGAEPEQGLSRTGRRRRPSSPGGARPRSPGGRCQATLRVLSSRTATFPAPRCRRWGADAGTTQRACAAVSQPARPGGQPRMQRAARAAGRAAPGRVIGVRPQGTPGPAVRRRVGPPRAGRRRAPAGPMGRSGQPLRPAPPDVGAGTWLLPAPGP